MEAYTIRNNGCVIVVRNPESFKETDDFFEFYAAGMFVTVSKDENTTIEERD